MLNLQDTKSLATISEVKKKTKVPPALISKNRTHLKMDRSFVQKRKAPVEGTPLHKMKSKSIIVTVNLKKTQLTTRNRTEQNNDAKNKELVVKSLPKAVSVRKTSSGPMVHES